MDRKTRPVDSHCMDFRYQGRDCSVVAYTRSPGWSWGAIIGSHYPMEHRGEPLATLEKAHAHAKGTIQAYIAGG